MAKKKPAHDLFGRAKEQNTPRPQLSKGQTVGLDVPLHNDGLPTYEETIKETVNLFPRSEPIFTDGFLDCLSVVACSTGFILLGIVIARVYL